jgi:hypothetical protein
MQAFAGKAKLTVIRIVKKSWPSREDIDNIQAQQPSAPSPRERRAEPASSPDPRARGSHGSHLVRRSLSHSGPARHRCH